MKKVIYSMVACVALFATSCSNDEIEIDLKETGSTLNIVVSTSEVYDELDMTYSITNQMLGGYDTYYVAIWSLLYDANGTLVDSVNSYTRSLSVVNQKFDNLQDDTYTLITLETLVDADNDYNSYFWELKDIDQLTTLLFKSTDYAYPYWYCSVGLNTQSVTISGDSKSINVTPVAMGSTIDFTYESFVSSADIIQLGYYLKNMADGRYLNPAISISDSYYYEEGYNASNYYSTLGAFYSSSGLDGTSSMDLYLMQTGTYTTKIGYSTSDDSNSDGSINITGSNIDFEYEDGGVYVAYAYYTGGSTIVETYLGDGDDFDDWYTSVGSSSSNSSFSFEEPYTTWGATVTKVKSYMSDYTLYSEDTSDGCTLIYYGKDPVAEVDYLFSSSTTGLYESIIYFYSTDVTEEDLLSYLEDFEYLAVYEYSSYTVYLYYTSDYETVIYLWDLADYYGYYELDYCSYDYLSSNTEEERVAKLKKMAEDKTERMQIKPTKCFKAYDFKKSSFEKPLNEKMIETNILK